MIRISDMPPWLHFYVKYVFSSMENDGALNERERTFFTDARLKSFWVSVGKYLDVVNPEHAESAASTLIGAFLCGVDFYGYRGTMDRPSPKVKARQRQKDADILIIKAAKLAKNLAAILYKLEQTTHVLPDDTWLMPLFRKVAIDVAEPPTRLPSHWENIRTEQLLRELGESLRAYPLTDQLFSSVPGMASRESSWRDWMREAYANIQMMLIIYPGAFTLREKHWVSIANVLIDENITRDSVHPVFTELNNGTI